MSEPKTVEEFARLCADADRAIARAEKAERERDAVQERYQKAVNRINMALADGRRYERERDAYAKLAVGDVWEALNTRIQSLEAALLRLGLAWEDADVHPRCSAGKCKSCDEAWEAYSLVLEGE